MNSKLLPNLNSAYRVYTKSFRITMVSLLAIFTLAFSGNTQTTNIELCVDLSCFPSVTAPSVFGAFNGWCANCNPITDPDGDDVYCATVALAPGPQEYLFFFQEEGPEDMIPGDPCTVTNFGFTNRLINVVAGVTQSVTFGWETCDPTCGPPPVLTDIELCVDLSCFPSVTAPSVFGTFNGWNAGANPITDPDGDGVYCATVQLLAGPQEYKFFFQEEGPEDMTPGDPCVVTNFGFTNRVINVVAGVPQSVTFGWETCDPDCGAPPALTDIELCVDLSCFPTVTAPSVFGTFNGWNAGANPITDPDGDGVYCATIALLAGPQEFKFFFQEEGPEDMDPTEDAACTVTNFGFTNRVINVVQGVTQSVTFGWETCDPDCGAPPALTDIELCVDLSCFSSVTAPSVFGQFNGWNAGANPVTDPDGDGIYCATVQMLAGPQEYLFFFQEEGPEGMTPGDPCTVTNFGFTNRIINVVDGVTQSVTFAWELCGPLPPPIVSLTCPPTVMADGCSSSDAPPYADLAAFIADGGVQVDADPSSFMLTNTSATGTGTCMYTLVRTYEVTDDCGNTATCDHTVILSDQTPPDIQCPADMTVECFTDIVVDITLPIVNDLCDANPMVSSTGPTLISGQNDCNGAQYEVTYTAVDACGGTQSCTQTWTLQNSGPILTCPAPVIIECLEDAMVDESDVMVVTSCGIGFTTVVTGPNIRDGEPNCPGTRYEYTYIVTDDCGRVASCKREFLIENNAPELVCLPGQTVECAEDIITDETQVIITTSCGEELDLIVSDPVISNGANCPGTYTFTYSIEDACGRSAQCTQTWTIDNADPMILQCAPDRVVECSDDVAEEPESLMVQVSCGLEYDITPGPIVAMDNLGDCPGATYQISYLVEDACGRTAQCTQTFTVDNRAPRVFPDEDQIVTCRDEINPRWEDTFVETDCNMGIVQYEIIGPIEDESQPDCNGKIINYLYSVWDACGRMTCVAQAWTIQNDGPSFDHSPADVTVDCNSIPDGLDVTASFSGCGSLQVEMEDIQSPLSGNDYMIQRTFRADDGCGNSIEQQQEIMVLCTAPPSEEEYCSYTEEFWGDSGQSKLLIYEFDISSNPIKIGVDPRSIILTQGYCVNQILPSNGEATTLPKNEGTEIEGCLPANIAVNEDGTLTNTLAGQLIALKLNTRFDASLAEVKLKNICENFPEKVIYLLPESPLVMDLISLADETLGEVIFVNPEEMMIAVRTINEYFEGCRILEDCDEGNPIANPNNNDNKPGRGNNELLTLNDNLFSIIPNPAVDQIQLSFLLAEEGEALIRVFNNNGQLMHQIITQAGKRRSFEEIEISNWPTGMYFITLQSGSEIISKRIIKQE